MSDFTARERLGLGAGTALYLALTTVGIVLFNIMEPIPLWLGVLVGGGASAGLIALVGITVRATRRRDNEGVEREVAAQASMVTVLVLGIAGLSYSLLEAFAGAPRVTAAVMSAFAGLVWVCTWTWLSRHFK